MIKGWGFCVLLLASTAAWSKSCEEVKAEIRVKLQSKGIEKFRLDLVETGTVTPEDRVVGRCEDGTRQIVYRREEAAKNQ